MSPKVLEADGVDFLVSVDHDSHVTLSERSLRAKSLSANYRRFFVARRTLAPHANRDKPVIY